SGQFHYIKRALFMPFLLAEILNFQGTEHLIGVGSLSYLISWKYLLTPASCHDAGVKRYLCNKLY
ncbi:hypothetical protein, partial [Bariatricus sp. HCP28S3_D3]|uniref:hypothetical protein n=1 Tax=Bariatricus sp. HCP28S3_D3 TaxID=3438901 RepID=UPI003F8A7FEB